MSSLAAMAAVKEQIEVMQGCSHVCWIRVSVSFLSMFGTQMHTTNFCYVGAANAGIPLSIIVKNYGWNAYFTALLIACGMAILLLAPMVNLKSYVQREGALKGKTA